MTTIRLLVAMSGAEQSWPTGALYECDDASAARLVAAGYAEWLPAAADVPELAVTSGAPERAMRQRGRPRGMR